MEEFANLVREQLGLLEGGEMPAARHLGPAGDLEGAFREHAWCAEGIGAVAVDRGSVCAAKPRTTRLCYVEFDSGPSDRSAPR